VHWHVFLFTFSSKSLSSRTNEIVNLLNTLASSPTFRIQRFIYQVFEVCCYLKEEEEFGQNGKILACMLISSLFACPLGVGLLNCLFLFYLLDLFIGCGLCCGA
jgi:hypothetical protein